MQKGKPHPKSINPNHSPNASP